MPYLIRRPNKRALASGVVSLALAGAGLGSAAAPALASTSTSTCTEPSVSQPFLTWGDSNTYFLPGGETAGSFNGAGWTFTGGAAVIKATLANGTSGTVLYMPAGSTATSPSVCVNQSDPTARAMIEDVSGAAGIQFFVGYQGTQTWTAPQNTGQIHGQGTAWTLTDPVNVQPSNIAGWQIARFTFENIGGAGTYELYNFYIDPYAKH